MEQAWGCDHVTKSPTWSIVWVHPASSDEGIAQTGACRLRALYGRPGAHLNCKELPARRYQRGCWGWGRGWGKGCWRPEAPEGAGEAAA